MSTQLFKPTVRVAGVEFVATDLQGATSELTALAGQARDGGVAVRLVNTYSVAAAHEDPDYWQIVTGDGHNLPDGKPIGVILRCSKTARGSVRKPGQVRGPSLFQRTLQEPAQGVGHFFLGTTEETLDLLLARLSAEAPDARVVGSWAPPFMPMGSELVEACIARLERCDSRTIVWVALGTPKQDILAAELARRTDHVFVGVGAAFDFYAGTVQEAPKFMRRAGMEWFFRLLSDPRRLWRRYTFGTLRFIRAAIADGLRRS